jgi:transposase
MTVEELVPDGLWAEIAPLLPPPPPRPKGGRRRVPYRTVVAGIVYVLRTGAPWRYVAAGELWQRGELLAAGRVAAGRGVGAAARSAVGALPRRWWAGLVGGQPGQHQRAGQAWGELVGANPTDRGEPGSKYHLIVDGAGLPLAALLSAANTHDPRLLVALVDRVGPVRGRVGRPRRRPERVYADKASDFGRCRRALRERGIGARIARRGVQPAGRLGRQRWKVERTIAWLLGQRRLQVRYERLAAVLEGLLLLACALVCWRTLATLRGGT